MRPGDIWVGAGGWEKVVGRAAGVSAQAAFTGAGIGQAGSGAAEDCPDGPGIVRIIEVTTDNEVGTWISAKNSFDGLPEFQGFLLAPLGFIRFGDRSLGFEVGPDEGEPIGGGDRDIEFEEAAADPEASAVEKETVVGVRTPGEEREAAEDGELDVGIGAVNQFAVRQVESGRPKPQLQIRQGVRSTHLLKDNNVGVGLKEGVPDRASGFGRLGGAGAGRVEEIILDVVSRQFETGFGVDSEDGGAEKECAQPQGGGCHGLQRG